MRWELDDHDDEICLESIIVCDECDGKFKRKDEGYHDCIEYLKK